MFVRRAGLAAAMIAANSLAAQSAPKVGPAHGTVIVVGGGSMGPEIYQRFIAAAGGPDALIIDVPTADQMQKLKDLGYAVVSLPDGKVEVSADINPAATTRSAMDELVVSAVCASAADAA